MSDITEKELEWKRRLADTPTNELLDEIRREITPDFDKWFELVHRPKQHINVSEMHDKMSGMSVDGVIRANFSNGKLELSPKVGSSDSLSRILKFLEDSEAQCIVGIYEPTQQLTIEILPVVGRDTKREPPTTHKLIDHGLSPITDDKPTV